MEMSCLWTAQGECFRVASTYCFASVGLLLEYSLRQLKFILFVFYFDGCSFIGVFLSKAGVLFGWRCLVDVVWLMLFGWRCLVGVVWLMLPFSFG